MNRAAYLGLLLAVIWTVGCARTPQKALAASEPVRISADGAKAAEPAVATGANGALYAVYVEHHGNDGADVMLQRLDADGKAAGESVRVNDEENVATAWRGDPPAVAVGRDGTIFVGWTRKYADPDTMGNDLMLSASRDGGRTFDPAVKVNDDAKPAAHGMHSLAVDERGRVIMAWLDERNIQKQTHKMDMTGGEMHHETKEPNSEVFTAVSDDGGRTFSPNVKISADACPCCKTSLLAAADGKVYASWRQVLEGDHRHIAVAASKDGGRTFAPGVIVSNDNWQLSACPVSGAALASTAKDELEVTWYTEGAAGPAGLYVAHSNDGGKTFSARELVSDAAKSGTPVLAGNICIFNGKNGVVRAQTLSDQRQSGAGLEISSAGLPAAAPAGGKVVVAFVRSSGDASAVWTDVIG